MDDVTVVLMHAPLFETERNANLGSRSIARVNLTMVINNRTWKFSIESENGKWKWKKGVLSFRSGKFRLLGMERIKVRRLTFGGLFEQWPPTETEACFFGRVFTRKVACRYDRYLDLIEMFERVLFIPLLFISFIYFLGRSIDEKFPLKSIFSLPPFFRSEIHGTKLEFQSEQY